jgi:GNAT superfamily N-acetyltransferase
MRAVNTGGICDLHAAPKIVEGYRPGALGRLIEMHGVYYAREWDFGPFFEAKVASEAAAFFQRYDPKTDNAWFVLDNKRTIGSLIIDGGETYTALDIAHLRWFILEDECRGFGIGDQLMTRAMAFCDAKGFRLCYLTTFAGLDAARTLYEQHDFQVISEEQSETWGTEVTEQRWERVKDGA